ncbi:MAG: TetR/AcrR family transcriptional regulator [Eubacterium sp.]|nr:TetR/AcrR family transcriptional regulator [Eubacterium sp.]
MEKGNKKKKELQSALKTLAIEKGYANVTMKDIGNYVGISVGGLYHHYHSTEEIFNDLIKSETSNVWDGFSDVKSFDELMDCLNIYFESEKKELLGKEPSLNTLLYQYYFSHPESRRIEIMKLAHDETIDAMMKILNQVYKDKKLCREMSEHIYLSLHGLVDLSFSNSIRRKIIENEIELLKIYLTKMYKKQEEE